MGNPFDQFDTVQPVSTDTQQSSQNDSSNVQGQQNATPNNTTGDEQQATSNATGTPKYSVNPFDRFDAPVSNNHSTSPKSGVTGKDDTSFVKNPTWKNLGNAAVEGAEDAWNQTTEPIAHTGRMVYGDWQTGKRDPIVTDSVPETVGNVAQLAMPFMVTKPSEGEPIGSSGPSKTAQSAQPTANQIRNIAGRTFDAAEEAGGALPAMEHEKLINEIQQQAQQSPEAEAYFGPSPLKDMSDRAETQRGNPLSFAGATEIDKELTGRIRNETQPDGFVTPIGQKYTAIQDALRDSMNEPTAGEGFDIQNQAKALWSQQARMREIQGIMEKSANMQNPSVSAQVMYRNLASNPRRFNLYTPEEQDMISDMAERPGIAKEALRTLSSRLLNVVGAAHGPVPAVAAQVGTAAARNLATRMDQQQQMKLLNAIGNRTELPILNKPYQARGGAVQKPRTGVIFAKPKSYPALRSR